MCFTFNFSSRGFTTTLHIEMSSVEVRVLCHGGEGCRGGEVLSDWSKMQDGRWKAAFWLDNNSRWQLGLWLKLVFGSHSPSKLKCINDLIPKEIWKKVVKTGLPGDKTKYFSSCHCIFLSGQRSRALNTGSMLLWAPASTPRAAQYSHFFHTFELRGTVGPQNKFQIIHRVSADPKMTPPEQKP